LIFLLIGSLILQKVDEEAGIIIGGK
jgi:hypothetical protein